MSKLPVGVTRFVSRRVLVGKQNAPHILFVAGIVGFVGTTVLASKATLKVPDILDDLDDKKENLDRLYKKGDVGARSAVANAYAGSGMEIVRAYAPAIIVGSASIVCLTKSHDILTKRNAALTAAYAALDQSYRAYRERVREHVGKPAEELLYRESQRETSLQQSRDPKTPNDYSGYARFFAKETTPSWSPVPEYNLLFLRSQQNYANDLLHARGHVFLNEIYDALGFDRSRAGAAVGWVLSDEGDNYIDFGIFDPKSRSSIEFVNGHEAAILLDFNVDGVIFDKI